MDHVTFAPLGIFFPAILSSVDFFQNQLFGKILSRIKSECQTDWIQIWPDILLGLIWVQAVCKSYQQTTLGDEELMRNCDIKGQFYNGIIRNLLVS